MRRASPVSPAPPQVQGSHVAAVRDPRQGPLYEVELTGGRKVTVTGSHSVFALSQKRIVAFRVEDLRVGDYVVVPNRELPLDSGLPGLDLRPWLMALPAGEARGIMLHGMAKGLPDVPRDWKRFDFVPLSYIQERRLVIPEDARVNVRFGRSRLPVVLSITPALLRFLGLYAAEGTRQENTIFLSFGAHEKELINGTLRLVKEAFGDETRASIVPAHRTAVCVKVYSTILSRVLRDVFRCGDRAFTKRVPDVVFNVSRDLQEEYLRGYIDGDGHRGPQKVTLATVSDDLATGIGFLLAALGKSYSVGRRGGSLRTFPGGYQSACRPVSYIYVYGAEGTRGQPRSPL